MFGVLSDPIGYRFLPDDPPASVQWLRDRYERQSRGRSADGSEIWLNWILRRRSSGQAIGYVQATIAERIATIGYHLQPQCWGVGLGRASVALLLQQIFARDDVDDVQALIDTRNAASIALVRSLGFQLVETIRDADHFKGESSNEYRFVLSRSDWTKSTQAGCE